LELSPDSNELAAWLRRLEARAPASRIDLGLDRVRSVYETLSIDLSVPVITVAGTNGKGSVVALLESMLGAAGHRTLAYTSPHLLKFSERMRLGGRDAPEADIVAALDAVERARRDVDLTYFEHTTLAALWLASTSGVDAVLLEVGLGGRLDAVNVVDADVAVITSIGIDHTEFLGETRDEIAVEKAGIARRARPVVVGDPDPPAGLNRALETIGAQVHSVRDALEGSTEQLVIRFEGEALALPNPALSGEWQRSNAAAAVMALRLLAGRLPVSDRAMAEGLASARLPGRFQIVGEQPRLILDVAHNPAAAEALARALGPSNGRSTAVFSALAGKDVEGIGRALDACFTHWLVAPLGGDRGQSADTVARQLADAPVSGGLETVESLSAALEQALAASGDDDRVVVFGSFHTVAEAWPELTSKSDP
jgi:dihydrofolate synthase/folylpolyglutamate synthase